MRTRKKELISDELKPFVGELIRENRKKFNYSLEDLSEALNHKKNRQTLHKYETGLKVDSHQADVYAVQNWVVGIQGQMLYAASDSFIEHYDEIMDGSYRYELFKGSKVEGLMEVLGKIAYKYAFTSKPIYKLEIAADTIFNFLLEKYTCVPHALYKNYLRKKSLKISSSWFCCFIVSRVNI